METVHLELPAALLEAADLDDRNVAQDAARLLALELFREERFPWAGLLNSARRLWPPLLTSPPGTAFHHCVTTAPILLKSGGRLTGFGRDLVKNLYPHCCTSREVYAEIVISGAGMPGADQVAKSDWI